MVVTNEVRCVYCGIVVGTETVEEGIDSKTGSKFLTVGMSDNLELTSPFCDKNPEPDPAKKVHANMTKEEARARGFIYE